MSITAVGFPQTADNVAWARSVYPLTHADAVCDLFQSNVLTPRQLLLDDIATAQASGTIAEGIADTDPWGNRKLRSQLSARTGIPAEQILVFDDFGRYEKHRRAISDSNRGAAAEAHAVLTASGRTTNPFPAQGVMWFADIAGCDNSFAAAERLVQEHGVLVTPGEFYGVPGSVRIGLTREPAEAAEGLDRLVSALTTW